MAELIHSRGVPVVSVVICTHDRAHILTRTLPLVLRSTREVPGDLEMIVVDNGSRDETRDVVRRIAAEEGVDCRLIPHATVGLSGARNTGAAGSRAPVVWYLDDDAVPRAGWASAVTKAVWTSDLGMMGGRASLAWPSRAPSWLPREMQGYYGSQDFGAADRSLTWPEYPFGVNMGVRKETLEAVGGFRDELGRRGGTLISNEDKEFAFRVTQGGWRTSYLAAAEVDHLVPPERVGVRWLVRRSYWQGVSDALFWKLSRRDARSGPQLGVRRGLLARACQSAARLLEGWQGVVYLAARSSYRAGVARGSGMRREEVRATAGAA